MDELRQKLGLQGGASGDWNGELARLQEERGQLQEQVSSFLSKLQDTEKYNGQLVQENSSLSSQLQDQEAENSRLRELESQLSKLGAERDGELVAAAQVQTDLEHERTECERLRRELEAKTADCVGLEVKAANLDVALTSKQTELSELQADLHARQQMEEADDKNQELQDMLITKSHEMNEIKQQLSERTRQLSSVEAKVVTLEQQLEEQERSLKLQFSEERSKATGKSSAEMSQVQAQLAEKCAECEALETEVKEGSLDNKDLRSKLSQLEEKISTLNTEVQAERERAYGAEKTVKDLQQRLMEEKLRGETVLKERDALEGSELNSLRSQLDSMKSQYESISNDNDNYQSLMTTLSSNNSALKREVEELRFKMKKSQGGNSGGSTDHDTERAMAELSKRVEEAEQEKEELSEEFEEVREELISLRRERTSLAQQVSDLTNTVQHLNEKVTDLEAELNKSTVAQVATGVTELPIKVERSVALGSSPGESSPKHQVKFDEELRSELSAAQAKNHQLQTDLDRMGWRVGEMDGLEQELDELRALLASANMEKKILTHDLEEVRAEMSALQTDKHLLMKEVSC